jgi:hypothetical protein
MMADKTMHDAFAEAYAEMMNPKKNATNPAFKSKYANLEELLNVTRPVLAAEGFSLVQEPVNDGEAIGIHTRLIHKSGEAMDFGTFVVPLSKHDAQGAGSALTYCRRYAIAAIFGLAQEDDDGSAASAQKTAAETPEPAHVKLASDNQINAIFGLARDLGWADDYLARTVASLAKKSRGVTADHPGDLTGGSKGEASAMIEHMKKLIAEQQQKIAKTAEELTGEPYDPEYSDEEIPF